MKRDKKERREPLNRPRVRQNTMRVPAISMSAGATVEGPYIIASEAMYPLEPLNNNMMMSGQASLAKMTGSWVCETLDSRKKGKNTTRRME